MTQEIKVSVIIPVYNVEEYLCDCLNSLVKQTIDKNEMEVLLIDDGSTDSSLEICHKYEEKYPFFKVFAKQNEGVSFTRNFGIKNAIGKYILYLDSDDQLTPESVKSIVDFFDEVYDEVDLVTYFIQPYKDGAFLQPHNRYKNLLTHSDVYDLEKHPYIVQTTMNICVKNLKENNIFFNTDMRIQEDQEYINRILMDKLKIGYCAQATYLYNRSNESSAVSTKFHAYYIFESSMSYFEDLFSKFEDAVPKYFQAVFFHDLRWKLVAKVLFPFHYPKEAFDRAIERIKNLLSRVDVDIITKNPSINKLHIHYWLALKPNVHPQPYVNKNYLSIVADGKTVTKMTNYSIRIIKIEQTDNNCFAIRGVIENGIYNYIDEEPEFYAIENYSTKKRVKVFPSKFSYVSSNIKTNKVYGFNYIINPDEVEAISFLGVIDSFEFKVRITFAGKAVFKHAVCDYTYARGNCLISYKNEHITFQKFTKDTLFATEKQLLRSKNQRPYVLELKERAIDYRYSHRVWLYSDLATVEKDNGYYQFINDWDKDDGIERYYVYTRPLANIEHLFTKEQQKKLIEFGSEKHKLLYLSAEAIISSFFGRASISPFKLDKEELDFYDVQHFKIFYLQHGVLHASFKEKYSAENGECDKIVVSTNFEIENLTKKYAFRENDLIKSGMPRYEKIDRTKAAKNRILFAPSWRSYLASSVSSNVYHISESGFKASDYYKNFNAFLTDPRLQKLLEENDIILDVKLHPIINNIANTLFNIQSTHINFVAHDVELSDYKAFITDFSSFVFDYAYLCRPVLYFVPDYPQFLSGMNLYRKLDLDWEDAFGAFVVNPDDAFLELEKIFKNDFEAAEPYKNRMSNFYLPINNCCQKIYKAIKQAVKLEYPDQDSTTASTQMI